MSDKNLSADKFVLVQSDEILYDESIKTESIGYYKDAYIRFKKNKASLVAAIILIFLIVMSAVGPLLKEYTLSDQNQKWANRLEYLPPRIEGLEWLGFDGYKTLEGFPLRFEELPEGVVIELYDEDPNPIGMIKAKVDYYAYIDYYFSHDVYTSVEADEYQLILDAEIRSGKEIILVDAPLVNGTHRIKLDFFVFLDEVYGMDNMNFWFGTDRQGRDMFTELWNGARLSLAIAFGVSVINIVVGLIVGSISGYYGGITDMIIERLSEILSGLPFLAILSLLLLRFGNEPWVVVLAFTATGWLGISRLARSQFYRYKNREYVLAARTLGAKDPRIMSRHIFPNAVGTLITSLVLYIPAVIFAESTFSYLGIINYGDRISVGRLLANGQEVMKANFYMVLFPAVFISLLMLSFNLFGNGLRDAFNPSLRGVEE
jgi:oligopeptide transport system permease protein